MSGIFWIQGTVGGLPGGQEAADEKKLKMLFKIAFSYFRFFWGGMGEGAKT